MFISVSYQCDRLKFNSSDLLFRTILKNLPDGLRYIEKITVAKRQRGVKMLAVPVGAVELRDEPFVRVGRP
jgi:hypothetical protein